MSDKPNVIKGAILNIMPLAERQHLGTQNTRNQCIVYISIENSLVGMKMDGMKHVG